MLAVNLIFQSAHVMDPISAYFLLSQRAFILNASRPYWKHALVFSHSFLRSCFLFHLTGNNKQHYHPEHDLHKDVSEVWAVGRQPCQHSVWAGFLLWASSGQGGWNSLSLLSLIFFPVSLEVLLSLSFVLFHPLCSWAGEHLHTVP